MLFTKNGNSIRRRLLALSLTLVLVFPIVAIAQDNPEKPIVDIKINGNDHVSSEAIMAAMTLKPGMSFTEATIQQAKQSIESMGYFQPGVTVGTETVNGGVRAIFNVVENPVVKAVNITGNTVVPTDKLMSLMRTSAGSVLNTDTLLQKDVRAIESYYEEQGYIAYVTEDIGIDPKTGALNIPVNEVKVENIKITGNKKTKDYVLLREMRQKPGQVYNVKTLHTDLQRVYDLNIFELESASSYKTEPGSDLGKVNIIIPVKEKKTGEVSVGLGYSSKNKLVGQAKLDENNFRGRAEKVNLLWEQSGTRGASYEGGFFEPWLDKKNTSFGVNLYNKLIYRFSSNEGLGALNTGNASNYDERRRGGSVTLSRPLSLINRGFLTIRTESVDSTVAETPTIDVPFNLRQMARVGSGTFRFTGDSRDSQLDPFLGGYNSGAVEMGSTNFTQKLLNLQPQYVNNTFAKYTVDVRRYLSRGGARKDFNEKRRRVALRLMGGATTGQMPFSEQYFVGGAETLRGYQEDRFWGKYMLLASGEYRMPLAPSLTGVAFVDYGDAWGAPIQYRKVVGVDQQGNPALVDLINGFNQHANFTPNLGYGVGIRVNTPLGPLRLDYGFGSEGSRAHFSIGNVF
jgi:outer membrane protein insertion porin family